MGRLPADGLGPDGQHARLRQNSGENQTGAHRKQRFVARGFRGGAGRGGGCGGTSRSYDQSEDKRGDRGEAVGAEIEWATRALFSLRVVRGTELCAYFNTRSMTGFIIFSCVVNFRCGELRGC